MIHPTRPYRNVAAASLVALALLCPPAALGGADEMTGDGLLALTEQAQFAYVQGWMDGYLQALDGVNDKPQLRLWRNCLQGNTMEDMRVRVVFYYSRHAHIRPLRLQLTMQDALLEACKFPPNP